MASCESCIRSGLDLSNALLRTYVSSSRHKPIGCRCVIWINDHCPFLSGEPLSPGLHHKLVASQSLSTEYPTDRDNVRQQGSNPMGPFSDPSQLLKQLSLSVCLSRTFSESGRWLGRKGPPKKKEEGEKKPSNPLLYPIQPIQPISRNTNSN